MVRQLSCGFRGVRLVAALAGFIVLLSGWLSGPALAASAKEIDAGADEALVLFEKDVKNGRISPDQQRRAGVPESAQGRSGLWGRVRRRGAPDRRQDGGLLQYLAGFIWIATRGRDQGHFYRVSGWEALKQFRASEGWKAGVDGSVSLATLGAGGVIDTNTLKDPIVGFVLGQKGLMYNLSFEGTKFSKLDKK